MKIAIAQEYQTTQYRAIALSHWPFPRRTDMSKSFYSEINLHIVWHTKTSLPLLTPIIEPIAYR